MKLFQEWAIASTLLTVVYGSPNSASPALSSQTTLSTLQPRNPASVAAGATVSCSPTNSALANGAPTNYCTCNNGQKYPFAPAGAKTYTPCPASVASPSPTTTTDGLDFPFTYTDPYGEKTAVIECQGSSVEDLATFVETVCIGHQVVLTGSTQFPPHPTLQVTAAKATSTYVGSITGSTLYASVTSALNNILPSVATQTTYNGGTVFIPNIEYPDGQGGLSSGDLEVTVLWATFQNGSMHDNMIKAAALAVNQTLEAKGACQVKDYPIVEAGARGGEMIKEPFHICQVAGAYNLNYFDGINVDGATDDLGFTLEFKGSQEGEDITEEICDEVMTVVDFLAALAAVFFPPSYLADEAVVKDLVQAGCGVAKDIQDGVHHVTSVIGG